MNKEQLKMYVQLVKETQECQDGYVKELAEEILILVKNYNNQVKEIERLNTTIQSNINSYNKLAKYSSELEDRIDKAIEYIDDNLYPVGNDVNGSDLPYDEAIQPLVDILRGDKK